MPRPVKAQRSPAPARPDTPAATKKAFLAFWSRFWDSARTHRGHITLRATHTGERFYACDTEHGPVDSGYSGMTTVKARLLIP